MGFEVRIAGPSRDLADVRRALRDLGNTGLGKEMGKQLRAATRPLATALRAEPAKAMPAGYAPLLSKSLRFRTAVKEARQQARLVYRVYADGQKERRDLPALNAGRLRHPVYGRRRQPWVNQRVRSGVVDRPVDRVAPQVGRQMAAVLDYVADQLKG